MCRSVLWWAVLSASASLSIPLASGAPLTQQFAIDADTYIDSQSPTTNYGTNTTVKVVVNGTDGSLARGLFELPAAVWSIPAGDLVSAKVWFWTFKDNTGSRTVRLQPLTRGFSEGGATWQSYDGTNSWASPGGDYDAGTFVDAVKGGNWFSWDITGLWNNTDLRSFGAILRMNDESNPGAGNMPRAPFNSSDNTAQTPYVEVMYVPEPASSVGLLIGLVTLLRRRKSS